MSKYTNEALRMIPFVQKAVQSLNDEDALNIKTVYPNWDDLVPLKNVESNEAGFKFVYKGEDGYELYKCLSANPTFQADWIPGVGTESLYARIDETHDGTYDNPIPYKGNMELVEGLYYTQNNIIYLCIRNTDAPMYHALADLVNLYVEIVE